MFSCSDSAPPRAGPESEKRVAIIGDSQLYQAETGNAVTTTHVKLTEQFTKSGYQPLFKARIGSATIDLVAGKDRYFKGWPAPGPDITVTVEGTNDMRINPTIDQPYTSFAEASANYDHYLKKSNAKCDVIIGIVQTAPWGLDKTGPLWNQFLQSEATSRNGVFVDWWRAVQKHPDYIRPDDPARVHQSDLGQIAFRAAINAAVGTCNQRIVAAGQS